ncbi:hypothetical protein [Paenibacillus sp. UNC217MF]|uniref:hypothetical protein n=1 Tax=Paenibacillus sp. UNC217MF TaxID=1449062 RepID=UPI00055EBCAA|nr:hypothetical protein [Paenibacillus sp. UNC217MF]
MCIIDSAPEFRLAILLGKVFTDARGWRNPETKESLVRFLLTLNKGMEMAASKISQDVRVANRNLSKALDFYSSIDRWDLPNRFRVQDIDPVLFDGNVWDGSKEWDVPGTKHRILERTDGRFGYVVDHGYSKPKLFPSPWFQDGGKFKP